MVKENEEDKYGRQGEGKGKTATIQIHRAYQPNFGGLVCRRVCRMEN